MRGDYWTARGVFIQDKSSPESRFDVVSTAATSLRRSTIHRNKLSILLGGARTPLHFSPVYVLSLVFLLHPPPIHPNSHKNATSRFSPSYLRCSVKNVKAKKEEKEFRHKKEFLWQETKKNDERTKLDFFSNKSNWLPNNIYLFLRKSEDRKFGNTFAPSTRRRRGECAALKLLMLDMRGRKPQHKSD